jgi:hypothetical protein
MRKINQMLCHALDDGREIVAGRTSRTFKTPTSMCLLYHRTTVVQLSMPYMRVTLGGYDSRTTKDRVNSVLEFFSTGFRIVHRNKELTLVNLKTQEHTAIGKHAMIVLKSPSYNKWDWVLDAIYDRE